MTKIIKNEYWDYLPTKIKRIRRKRFSMAEKNLLAVLIFHYLKNKDYREQQNGWFYVAKSSTLVKETGLSVDTIHRSLVNLRLENAILCRMPHNLENFDKNCQKMGINDKVLQKIAKIEHFQINPKIVELLQVTGKNDDFLTDTSIVETTHLGEDSPIETIIPVQMSLVKGPIEKSLEDDSELPF